MSAPDELQRFEPLTDPRPDDRAWPELRWPVPADIRLTGDVVQLDPVDPARDAGELFRALDHDAVWAHVPRRPLDSHQLADILRARCELPDWNPWVLRLRRPVAGLPAGAVVGTTSYMDASVADARLEIGFTVYTPAVWATAINPETKLLLFGHAFDVLRAGRVQLKTDIRNHRSQQAIARLGAHYEGTLRRHFRRSDGTVRDTVMFAVTAEDWPQVQRRLTTRLAKLRG